MSKLDTLALNAKCKLNNMKEGLHAKAAGDESAITKVMWIVIAVFIIIIFRNQLADMLRFIFTGSTSGDSTTGGIFGKITGMYQ